MYPLAPTVAASRHGFGGAASIIHSVTSPRQPLILSRRAQADTAAEASAALAAVVSQAAASAAVAAEAGNHKKRNRFTLVWVFRFLFLFARERFSLSYKRCCTSNRISQSHP